MLEEPLLHQILPLKKQTLPPNSTKREILDGIFYQLKNGCYWADLPCVFTSMLYRIVVLPAVARIRSASTTDESIIFEPP
ncbi:MULTISPECIES: transposase [unclassified Microcoleus]|uniref:transposase n=1 Tax=unclassified Microcoleus TaxID=2642155 RepID=UPI00403FB69C